MDRHDGAGYSVYRSHICISLYITDILWVGLISLSDPVQDRFSLDLPRIFFSLTLHNTDILWIDPYFSYKVKYRYSVDRSCICLSFYSIDILCTCPVFVSQCTVRIFCATCPVFVSQCTVEIFCIPVLYLSHSVKYRYSVHLSYICLTAYNIDMLRTCPMFVSQCTIKIFCAPVLYLSHSVQYRYSVHLSYISLTVYSTDILCTCPIFVSHCTVQIFCAPVL